MTIGRSVVLGVLLSLHLALTSYCVPTQHKSVYDYSLVGLDGKEVSLATYKGKVLLIVNLASKSIYAEQIQALEEIQKAYADKGLQVIGIPSSDFGTQELTDNSAIQTFYLNNQHVTFPIFSKTSLRGKDCVPLVHFLTDSKEGAGGGDIHWNFTKFVVDRQGKPILRLEADSDPADPNFHVTLEQILNGTYKKKGSSAKDDHASASEEDDDSE